MKSFVFCGIGHSPAIQDPGDRLLSITLQIEGENFPNNLGCLRIDNEMSLQIRVFHIPIRGKRTDVIPLFPPGSQYGLDIVRQLFKKPFIDKTIDLSGFFVSAIVRVDIVYETDESDSQSGKQTVDILFYQFQLAGKTGLRFAEDNIEFPC